MLKVRFVLADSQVLVIKSAIFFFIPVMFATMSIVILTHNFNYLKGLIFLQNAVLL